MCRGCHPGCGRQGSGLSDPVRAIEEGRVTFSCRVGLPPVVLLPVRLWGSRPEHFGDVRGWVPDTAVIQDESHSQIRVAERQRIS